MAGHNVATRAECPLWRGTSGRNTRYFLAKLATPGKFAWCVFHHSKASASPSTSMACRKLLSWTSIPSLLESATYLFERAYLDFALIPFVPLPLQLPLQLLLLQILLTVVKSPLWRLPAFPAVILNLTLCCSLDFDVFFSFIRYVCFFETWM